MKITAIAFLFLLLMAGTQASSAVANPLGDSIIINNFVFDSSGTPWLDGWDYSPVSQYDTASPFLFDSPPGLTGKWSIYLVPGWAHSSIVRRSFTNLSSGVYQLTCWAKSPQRGGGQVYILLGGSHIGNTILTTDTNWRQYALTDTLTLSSSDTIETVFTGGFSQLMIWKVLFNDITFEKLEANSAVAQLPTSKSEIQIYPNPFSKGTTINVTSTESGMAEIAIVNILGQEVKRIFSGELAAGEHSFSWDAGGMAPGMYICVVRSGGSIKQLPITLIK
jgi:hypothetical protein